MYEIVVVEDEKPEREALVQLIRKEYSSLFQDVSIAITGPQAVKIIREKKPDFLLMDIHLPGMSGLDVLQEIRPDCPDTEVAVITAYNQFEYARQSIRLGVREYLLKPVPLKDFYSTMDLMIRNREKRRKALTLLENLSIFGGMEEWEKEIYEVKKMDKLFNAFSLLSLSGSTESAAELVISKLEKKCTETADPLAPFKNLILFLISFSKSLDLPDSELFRNMDDDFFSLLREEDFSLNQIQQLTNRFLLNVNKYLDGCESFSNNCGLVRKIDDWLEENYMNNINLNQLAVKTKRNPAYISRLYKNETGTNLKDRIKQIRITQAKKMLETGDFSIKEVAYSTGFNDPNYFSLVFKKETGIQASDYSLYYGKKL